MTVLLIKLPLLLRLPYYDKNKAFTFKLSLVCLQMLGSSFTSFSVKKHLKLFSKFGLLISPTAVISFAALESSKLVSSISC